MWFRITKRQRRFNTLKYFLESKDIIRLTKKNCEKENFTKEDAIYHIALLAATKLDGDLFFDVFYHFLVSKPAGIKKQVRREAVLLLEELGIKLNRDVK